MHNNKMIVENSLSNSYKSAIPYPHIVIDNFLTEEGLQFVVGINAKSHINSMVNAIETPKLSIYSS